MLHMLATKNVSKMFEIYLDFRNVSSKYTEVKERGRGTKKKTPPALWVWGTWGMKQTCEKSDFRSPSLKVE